MRGRYYYSTAVATSESVCVRGVSITVQMFLETAVCARRGGGCSYITAMLWLRRGDGSGAQYESQWVAHLLENPLRFPRGRGLVYVLPRVVGVLKRGVGLFCLQNKITICVTLSTLCPPHDAAPAWQ